MFAPRLVNGEVKEVSLTGMIFPWKYGQPVLLSMPMSDALYLALFDSEVDLRAVMDKVGVPFDGIKLIDNGSEFLQSLPEALGGQPLKIILNPWFTEGGTVRYTEIQR